MILAGYYNFETGIAQHLQQKGVAFCIKRGMIYVEQDQSVPIDIQIVKI
jgi:hypothetical protein